ncbi:MAG: serine/threonine protein kinase [Myxococcota bacterium]|jgi:serine/threonine protein kinase
MLRSGDRIGDWVVETQLGTGGMASVWQCHSRHAPRMKVAVKVLVGGEAAELRREAEALAALSHPGVVRVYAPGEDAERECLFLAMELVEGETLRHCIRDGALSPTRVRALTAGILDALDAVHRAGICHRDLKPANIMIRPDGRPVLVDFGIARDSVSRSPTGDVLGTPSYIAPERLSPGDADPARVDLYALGVSLFEALTGRAAFVTPAELTPQQRAWRIIEMKRTAPALDPGPDAPVDLRTLVRTLTQPDPRKRPDSAAAALSLLSAPVAVSGEQTVRVPDRPPRRPPLWPILGLVVALGLGVAVMLRGEEPEVVAPMWDEIRLPAGEELLRTDDSLLLGIPGGEVEALADAVGQGLLEDGWRMTEDRSSGGISVELFARDGRHLGVLVSAEGPAAFVLLEDLDTIDPAESQLGLTGL